jgi:hypothetical protein
VSCGETVNAGLAPAAIGYLIVKGEISDSSSGRPSATSAATVVATTLLRPSVAGAQCQSNEMPARRNVAALQSCQRLVAESGGSAVAALRHTFPAQAHELDHLPMRGKAGAGGRLLQQAVKPDVLDFVAPSALLA